jgi:hypothetical protein
VKWCQSLVFKLAHNGPAVCFSRRNPTTAPGRVLVPRASGADKLSRCKEGLARVFAVMVQFLLRSGAIAVQVLSELRTYHRLHNSLGALALCRAEGPDRSEASVRGTKTFIACRCACPGARTITNLS